MTTALTDPIAETDWDVLPDWWHAVNTMAPPTLDDYTCALETLRRREHTPNAQATDAYEHGGTVAAASALLSSDVYACSSDLGEMTSDLSCLSWAPSCVLRVEVYDAAIERWIDIGLTFHSRTDASRALAVCRKRKPSFRFRVTG